MPHAHVLEQFLSGLQKGDFTLSEVAKEADIPLTTLADMRKPTYGSKLAEQIEKLEKVEKAIRRLRSRKAPRRSRRRSGEPVSA